jgi:hypothetical protein
VHFDLTAWPHYWFNDGMAADASTQALYANSIKGSDTLLTKFLALLARDKLLNHAIVIVLSDHGIGLGMPGDRAIQKDKFIGSRYDMRVTRYMYAVPLKNESFGIDTSYGYGGDVLSYNRQNQVLLAIKGYGFNTGTPHIVRERALTLDVAPTILDLLQLRGLRHADGLSWKPSLLASGYHLPARRDIYLESAMTSGDLTRKDINVSSVIAGVKNYFKINPDDGKVDLLPAILKQEIGLKQRVIIDGEWMLAYYPVSEKSEFIKVMNSASTSARKLKTVTVPPFFVLLNLRTGEWTTESTSTLAKSISIKKLNKKIDLFYGQEMAAYSGMQK